MCRHEEHLQAGENALERLDGLPGTKLTDRSLSPAHDVLFVVAQDKAKLWYPATPPTAATISAPIHAAATGAYTYFSDIFGNANLTQGLGTSMEGLC